MYKVTIKTKIPSLPEIHIEVEELNDIRLKELLDQEYVDKTKEVRVEKIKELTLRK